MRKTLLTLLSILCLTTVHAEKLTALSQLSNDKIVTISSARGFLMFSDNFKNSIAFSSGTEVGSVSKDANDPNQQFRIIEKEKKYYLFSIGANKYVCASGVYGYFSSTELKIEASGNNSYPWKLGLGDLYMNSQDPNQKPTGMIIDGWNTTDAGNSYVIDIVGEEPWKDITGQEDDPDAFYDFSGFDVQRLMDLFYEVDQKGRKFPTDEELMGIGILPSDLAFIRSHVRRAEILDRADRLLPETYERRNLFLNIPTDIGKDHGVGHPNGKFGSDVFSMWQYTNLFGSWNHGFFTAPGSWVDAAHRNGTDIMSGIAFFESWTPGGNDKEYSALITKKNSDGTFKYVRPLIHILMFLGSDGINYNWEDNSFSNEDIVAVHKELWKYAAEVGFTNYHSAIYTAVAGLSPYNTAQTNALLGNSEGKTHDLMLNYSNGDFTGGYNMSNSVKAAELNCGTADGLYTGVWIAGMDRSWNNLEYDSYAHKIGICLWGEHGQSRFMSYNSGDGTYDIQGNYQRLLERAMSGGKRNPIDRPAVTRANSGKIHWEPTKDYPLPLSEFAGIANWIPERSAIQGGFHFLTHFTLGNGDRYFYKGKKSYAGNWYNMGAQDIVPTYRWLRYTSGTTNANYDIDVNYTHLDAYTGGSSIELTGTAKTSGTDIVLYKTSLKVEGHNPYANIAVKSLNGAQPSNLYLILKKKGSDTWLEFPYGDIAGNTWEEKKIALNGLNNNDVVERVGFRVKGNKENYQLYIGKLELNDDSTITPANVKNIVANVKKETKTSMAVKLHWEVDAEAQDRAEWGLLYNDEANIDHFEILLKIGEEGRISKIGTTSQWATLIPNIDFESVNDVPYIGVRAISLDKKTYSPTIWTKVNRAAQSELPVKEDRVGGYGISQMDEYCEGADIAREQRYLTEVKTTGAVQNINYTADKPVLDGTQYADALDHTLIVRQGQEIQITLKGADTSDGLKYCFAGGWLDLNGSGDFDKPLPVKRDQSEIETGKTTTDPEGERIFFAGTARKATEAFQTTGVTFTFKVPENATPGSSRLRIVFSDAWFAGMFSPVGYHAKGFTIDFNAEIQGTNPGRTIVDTRDQGIAEEPEGVNAPTGVEEVEAVEVSKAEGTEGAIIIENAEVAWVYTIDGRLVEFAEKPAKIAIEPGTYLVKMQNDNIIRSAKVLVK